MVVVLQRMTYCVRCDKLHSRQTVYKWSKDHKFGFNIGDPVQWRAYLNRVRFEDGKSLPHYNERIINGVKSVRSPYVYKVYNWGNFKGNNLKKQSSYIEFFPGFNQSGDKLRLVPHGQLDYNEG